MRRRSVVVCAALLAGCGSRMVKLDPKKVSSMKLALVGGGEGVCPHADEWPEVFATIAYSDGKLLETQTPNHQAGTVMTKDLAWKVEVGTFDDHGVWVLPWDLFPWFDRAVAVRASIPSRPDMTASLRVTPRFDCGAVAKFRGLDGDAGEHGADGTPGWRGPRLDVALAYVDTTLNGRLVLVRVIDHDYGRREYYLVDPHSPKRFQIVANGGDGGAGANGSDGTDGRSGVRGADGPTGAMCQDGAPGQSGSPGYDGTDGGNGGRGGDGGPGGIVTVSYPASSPELASAVAITVDGGSGAAGGPGGHGGHGGQGGRGGSGGSAGPTSDPTRACTTHAGPDGRDGSSGRDGAHGATGTPGGAGANGTITLRPSTLDALFTTELARGWKLAR